MKHLLTSTLLLLAFLLPATLTAHDFEVDGIYYNIVNDNEASVTFKGDESQSYTDRYSGSVTIPLTVTYNGSTYSVTSIGNDAFELCSELTSVIIPNSVKSIGSIAFSCCIGLTSIDIPNSITYIGDLAFYGCTGLTTIDIPNSVTDIGPWAFIYCSGLKSVKIGNSVTYISDRMFEGCTGLTSIHIPNSVTTIGSYAFYGCTELTDVYSHITDLSQVSMGTSVFYRYPNNYAERTLHVPNGTSAAYQADSKWSQYFGSIVEQSYNFEVDGIYYHITCTNEVEVTYTGNEPGNNEYSGDITIPTAVSYNGTTYNVTAIGEHAFADCTGLKSITIPNTVTAIGKQAFINDAAIETVTCEATTPPSCDGLDIFPTNVYNHTPLFVPMGCGRAYMSNPCWGQFAKIIGAGDTNMDGILSITDVTTLINSLLNNGYTSPAADVNGDGRVSITDVTVLINLLLGNN